MRTLDSPPGLTLHRALALAGLLLWVFALGFLSGPARWELAHTYSHLIDGAGADLPALTRVVALPVLGLETEGFGAIVIRLLFFGLPWLGAGVILWLVLRTRSRESLLERVVLSAVVYAPLVFLLASILTVALWLPFSLL